MFGSSDGIFRYFLVLFLTCSDFSISNILLIFFSENLDLDEFFFFFFHGDFLILDSLAQKMCIRY